MEQAPMTRAEVDAFVNKRLAERRAAIAKMPKPAGPANKYGNGMRNLTDILTGQSPLQQTGMGAKTNGKR